MMLAILLSAAYLLLSPSPAVSQSDPGLVLDYDTAVQLASLPLECYDQEYPHKYGLTFTSDLTLLPPSDLHPAFSGCFDWHSSVHGHWMLAALANRYPDTELAAEVEAVFDSQFTAENLAAEMLIFEDEDNSGFERTYGWAWYLKLVTELMKSPLDAEKGWSSTLRPLADRIVQLWSDFLPDLLYPMRVGEHENTAFGLVFAAEYAAVVADSSFSSAALGAAAEFYSDDAGCPLVGWEPSGSDFLSPCLQEGDVMSGVFGDPDSYAAWLTQLVPEMFDENFYLEPGHVSDASDGKLVHLHGLNFSRAWNLYNFVINLPASFQADRTRFLALADEHVLESRDDVVDSEYSGAHWLATFLVYALQKREEALAALQ